MTGFNKFSSRSFDWVLCIAVILLAAMGLAAIYSVDLSRGQELIYFRRQALSFGIGLFLLFGASLMQYTFFRSYAKIFYGGTLLLLIGVIFFGIDIPISSSSALSLLLSPFVIKG